VFCVRQQEGSEQTWNKALIIQLVGSFWGVEVEELTAFYGNLLWFEVMMRFLGLR
jgi:hypothetical protein